MAQILNQKETRAARQLSFCYLCGEPFDTAPGRGGTNGRHRCGEPKAVAIRGFLATQQHLEPQEQRQLAAQITELERENEPVPAALDEEAVLGHLADLRSLLQQDIPEAAERLRDLFGLISITHKRVSGRHGARWTATFSPQLAEVLRHFAAADSFQQRFDRGPVDGSSTDVMQVNDPLEIDQHVAAKLMHVVRGAVQLAAAQHQFEITPPQ